MCINTVKGENYSMVKIILAILAVTVVGIVIFTAIDPSRESAGGNAPTTLVAANKETISCTITGEVQQPGTYVCDINSTLGDLIELAKGETSNADGLAYDTNYVLSNKLEFYIAPKYDHNNICATEPIIKVNINTAEPPEIETIQGIGNAISTAIVNYRKAGNKFNRLEDVKNVNGIGNATFEKLKNFIRLRDE